LEQTSNPYKHPGPLPAASYLRLTPRRFLNRDYAASIAGDLYGGAARRQGGDVVQLFAQQLHAGSKLAYLHQLPAGSVWTSLSAEDTFAPF
jgi:hypothetical protein